MIRKSEKYRRRSSAALKLFGPAVSRLEKRSPLGRKKDEVTLVKFVVPVTLSLSALVSFQRRPASIEVMKGRMPSVA
ncbi:hypothetical protein D3C73_817910 [compost metagenome]